MYISAFNFKTNCSHHHFSLIPSALSAMPTTMRTVVVLENEYVSDWKPLMVNVDGRQYMKLDIKDRTFFKFCTGKTFRLGSKHENNKYLLEFWEYMVHARSIASQKAFEAFTEELKGAAKNPGKDTRKRERIRKATMDDALTVGHSLQVPLAYDGEEFQMRMLFGVKKSDLWMEATPENLDTVAKCLKSDFDSGNFASTRPRGTYFRRPDHDADDDDDDVSDGDGNA